MDYKDFTVRISSRADGGYELEAESPCGQAHAYVPAIPDPQTQVAFLDDQLSREAEREERGEQDPRERLPRTMNDLTAELGRPLADHLFRDGIRSRFAQNLERLETLRSQGQDLALRLRLMFGSPRDTTGEDLVRFAPFPWEYLCHPELPSFLGLSKNTPIVRTLPTAEVILPLTVKPPLKVLLILSTPKGLRQLNLGEERRRILAHAKSQVAEKIQDEHQIEVKTLEDPTFDRVITELRMAKHHVLHFMGHGDFDRATGVGELFFVDHDGGPEAKNAEEIAFELAELRANLKLVVLNACRGGQVTRRKGHDPFGSVALALVRAGLPAVVAMQYPISDRSAIAFAGTFYQEIRAGAGVDEAVAESRRKMRKWSAEWGTPVLYLLPEDGRLFEQRREENDDRGGPEPPLRLGLRSIRGWGGKLAEESDYLLDLSPAFEVRGDREEGRFIKDPSDWNAEILPKVQRFFRRFIDEPRPLELIMPAHASVAFAAGYFCEAKSGQDLRIQQRGAGRTNWWTVDDGKAPPIAWREDSTLEVDQGAPDVAVVFSVARDIKADVLGDLPFLGLAVDRLVSLSVPEPGQLVIENGAHAWALAERAAERIRLEAKRPEGGVLHLFLAVPNTVAFFLGRLARPFGRVQLYEHDFEQSRGGHYAQSIEIVPRTLGHVELPPGRGSEFS